MGKESSKRSIRIVGPGAPGIDDEAGRTVRLHLGAPRGGGYSRPVADIVFVIDTTGSMSNKIAGLLASCATFAERLAAKKIDWRLAIVAFGDLRVPTDRIVASGYMTRIETVRRSLAGVPRFSGGGNRGESSLDALDRAIGLGARRGATRVVILITDESPHQHGELRAPAMAQRLRREQVVTFTVAPDLRAYRDISSRTGGRWFPVSAGTDFTSILSMFDRVVAEVAATLSTISIDAGGDVERYLLGEGRPRR